MRRLALGIVLFAAVASAQERRGLPFAPFGQAREGDWAVYVEERTGAAVGTETRAVAVRVQQSTPGVLELTIAREGKPIARATLPRDTSDPAALLAVLEERGAAVSSISNVASGTQAGFAGSWVFGRGKTTRDSVAVEAFVAPNVRAGGVVVARFVGTLDGALVTTELRLAGCGSPEKVEWGRRAEEIEKDHRTIVPAVAPLTDDDAKIERLLGEIEGLVAAKDHDIDALIVKFSQLNDLLAPYGIMAGPKDESRILRWGDRLERFKTVRMEIKREVYRREGESQLAALKRALMLGDSVAIADKRVRVSELADKLLREEDEACQKLGTDIRARAFELERKGQ